MRNKAVTSVYQVDTKIGITAITNTEISTNNDILIPRIQKLKRNRVVSEMDISAEHRSQTNIGNTDSPIGIDY